MITAAISFLVGFFLVTQASAQCPAGVTNPLQVLVGTWAYQLDGLAPSAAIVFASAGQFTASIGTDRAGNPIGRLAITATSNQNGSVTRLEADAGTYQVFPDCSGGSLTFNLSSSPVAGDFFFDEEFTQVIIVITDGSGKGTVVNCPDPCRIVIKGTGKKKPR